VHVIDNEASSSSWWAESIRKRSNGICEHLSHTFCRYVGVNQPEVHYGMVRAMAMQLRIFSLVQPNRKPVGTRSNFTIDVDERAINAARNLASFNFHYRLCFAALPISFFRFKLLGFLPKAACC
jgi:hypothetical protein